MAAVLHHVPPEPGVTEIRVHGVGGTSPASLLEQTGIRQVTGDDTAGLFRGVTGPEGRTVEAYSWGGLTARGRSRAFWVVLLPFSLVNIAGWMVEPPRGGGIKRSVGTKWHESCVQVIAVLATAAYVSAFALLTTNVVALQCGSIDACRDRHWYLRLFGAEWLSGQPGLRVLVGMVAPLLLLVGFYVLSVKSSSAYDDFGMSAREHVCEDDVSGGSVLGLPDLWYPSRWQRHLVRLHIAAPLLVLGGLLGRSAVDFERTFGVDVVPDALGNAVAVLAVVTFVVLLASLFAGTWRGGEALLVEAETWFGPFTRVVLGAAVALALGAAALTTRLHVADARMLRAGAEGPEAAWDLWGIGWAPIVLLGLGAAFVGLFSAVQVWRWFVWRRLLLDQFAVVLMIALLMSWPGAVPLTIAAALAGIGVQWGPRAVARLSDEVAAEGPEAWRLALFLFVCGSALAVRLATGSLDGAWGTAWPRLTPVALFTATLTAMVAIATARSSGVVGWTVVKTVALPLALLGIGCAVAAVRHEPAWCWAAAWLAFVALAIVWLAQFRFDSEPRWRWNGPAAVATLALALILGVFSGVVIRVVDHLGGDAVSLRATAFYEWTALGFAGIVLVLAAGMAVWFVALRFGVVAGPDGTRVPPVEALCELVRAGDVVVTMASLLLGMALLPLGAHLYGEHQRRFDHWIEQAAPDGWRGVVDAASWVAVGFGLLTLLAIRRGLRDSAFRTKVGIVWDLVTFWPRSFHPFAPPAYATRAVPEIQARLAEAAERGTVILSAHSQGSVIGLAAVASLKDDVRRRVVLVTHGSPISRFYERYFPRYFPTSLFDHCAASLAWAKSPADCAWLNFWRPTDPIGDPVFAGRALKGKPPRRVAAALGDITTVPDVRVPDPLPPESDYVLPAKPALRRHSGYMAYPAMSRTVDALAGELAERNP